MIGAFRNRRPGADSSILMMVDTFATRPKETETRTWAISPGVNNGAADPVFHRRPHKAVSIHGTLLSAQTIFGEYQQASH